MTSIVNALKAVALAATLTAVLLLSSGCFMVGTGTPPTAARPL
ncbi:hypothetical protein JMUB5695_03423 [Mycobacterium heckeshornense]|nr:hypothetical protein JMUB5695_03423 [Mycobacterium heckeshornense]